ncbi:MAG: NPXTG-anchored protein, partial [Ruminococcaceae bacterium]|nr:NPXTG-anchored protein [Oscillospiraceae bacterium]
TSSDTSSKPDNSANPSTGIALGVFPAILAAGAVIVIAKKRR